MFGLGRLLAAPVRLLNVPMRVADAALDYSLGGSGDVRKSERTFSKPLETVAEAIEEAVDEEETP